MNFELSFGGKICNFISLYRSPSRLSGTFEDFADNFELYLDKISHKSPYLSVVLGDFNGFDDLHQIGANTIKQLMKVPKLMQ